MKKLVVGMPILEVVAVCNFCGEEKKCFRSTIEQDPITVTVTDYGPVPNPKFNHFYEFKGFKDVQRELPPVDICEDCVDQLSAEIDY